jgi:hypothetical protein
MMAIEIGEIEHMIIYRFPALHTVVLKAGWAHLRQNRIRRHAAPNQPGQDCRNYFHRFLHRIAPYPQRQNHGFRSASIHDLHKR